MDRCWKDAETRFFGRLVTRLQILFGACFAAILFGTVAVQASSLQCDAAAREAAAQSGVPLGVLMAISRTETGRGKNGTVQPWPWTVNMEGKSAWFDSEDEARAFVFRHFKRGARSFDVGCFQINYKWHGAAFRSIEEMFDPVANALYAANFLRDLHKELGDWTKAAGAFHSRTPEYARKYEARFTSIQASLQVPQRALPKSAQAQRKPARQPNRFPLLQGGGEGGRLGSLMPQQPQTDGAFLGFFQSENG